MKARKQNRGDSKPDDSTARFGLKEKIFFDVPVYRLTKEEYESRQKDFIQKEQKKWGGKNLEEFYRLNPEYRARDESHLWNIYGGDWLFNEIVGFIRLFFCSTQIRGHYYGTNAKRIRRTRRKVFKPIGHEVTFPETIRQGNSNQEIFSLILKFLSRAQSEKELKNRYIYTSILENVGPHIDWNALLQEQFKCETSSNSCKLTKTK